MHECQECGQVCDCDQEDTWLDQPADCRHFARHEREELGDEDAPCCSGGLGLSCCRGQEEEDDG